MEENENERNPFQCMILVSLILLAWNDPRISSKTFRSPRFFMKALGRHAEHWAAISVEGWQITVPIWDSGGRVEANLLICKKGRKVVINYLSQLTVIVVCLQKSFVSKSLARAEQQETISPTRPLNGTREKNYVPKSLSGTRSGTNVLCWQWMNKFMRCN